MIKVSSIIRLVKRTKKSVEAAMPVIQQDIEYIIANRVDSEKRIEELLDILLDFLLLGYGDQEFKRLNSYYAGINRQNSKRYAEFYKDAIRS